MASATLEQLRRREPGAQAWLYKQVFPELVATCFKVLKDRVGAEQVAQDTWCDFMIDHVDKLRRAEAAGAYLRMMAVRRCVHLQRREQRLVDEAQAPELAGAGESELVEAIDRRHTSRLVARCMARLTPRARSLLRLRFFHDLSLEAVGAQLGVSKQYVDKVLRQALERLRKCVARGAAGSVPS